MKAMFTFALTRHLVCSPSLCRAPGAVVCVAVGHAVFNLNLESLRTHQGRRPDNPALGLSPQMPLRDLQCATRLGPNSRYGTLLQYCK